MDVVGMKQTNCERVHFWRGVTAPFILGINICLFAILGIIGAFYCTYLFLKEEPYMNYSTDEFIIKDKRWRYNKKKMDYLNRQRDD
jgi:hypothetical protein